MAKLFYSVEGKEHGPVTAAELKRLVTSRVAPLTLLMRTRTGFSYVTECLRRQWSAKPACPASVATGTAVPTISSLSNFSIRSGGQPRKTFMPLFGMHRTAGWR